MYNRYMLDHATQPGDRQPEEINRNCKMELFSLPHYWEKDHELSIELANRFSEHLEQMGVGRCQLVVREEYEHEEANLLHYLARVSVGGDSAELVESAVLTDSYSAVSTEEGVINGSMKVVVRLPAGTPVEEYRGLEDWALEKYKELLGLFYTDWNMRYNEAGPQFDDGANRQD
jgi:hypothetical protein